MAMMKVPVTKGKAFVEFDTDQIPVEMYTEALLQGLKVLVNRGTSKITKSTYSNPEELKAAAMAKAEELRTAIMENDTSKIKLTGAPKAAKVSGAVMTEARRLARNLIKDELKKAGEKVSHYKASEITKAANEYLASEQGAELVKQAEENLKARAEVKPAIDVKAILKPDAKLVAKAEAEAGKKKATLSATQAGKVQQRAKGQGARPNA